MLVPKPGIESTIFSNGVKFFGKHFQTFKLKESLDSGIGAIPTDDSNAISTFQ